MNKALGAIGRGVLPLLAGGLLAMFGCAPVANLKSDPTYVRDVRPAAEVKQVRASLPPVQTLYEEQFEDGVKWYLKTDIGLLHVYTGNKILTYDLLTGRRLGSGLMIADLQTSDELVPVAASNLVIVCHADRGVAPALEKTLVETEKDAKKREELEKAKQLSYAFDAFSGEIAWTNEEMWRPAQVYPFYDQFTAVFESRAYADDKRMARVFRNVDLLTGEELWTTKVEGSYLESGVWGLDYGWHGTRVLTDAILATGVTNVALDAQSGRASWMVENPREFGQGSVLLSPWNRLLVKDKKQRICLLSVPEAPVDSPAKKPPRTNAETAQLWSGDLGYGPIAVPLKDHRVFISGAKKTVILNCDDGSEIWTSANDQQFHNHVLSPDSTLIAVLGSKSTLNIIDAEKGGFLHVASPNILKIGSYHWEMNWIDSNSLQIVSFEEGKIKCLGRYDLQKKDMAWFASQDYFPEPPKLSKTSGEKWGIFGKAVLGAAVAVGAGSLYRDAIASGNLQMAQSANNLMNVGIQGVFSAIDDAFKKKTTVDGHLAASRGSLAARRYLDRQERMGLKKKEFQFVTGSSGEYALVSIDKESGAKTEVAVYDAEGVNDLITDIPYSVTVSLSDNRKHLRIVAGPDYTAPAADSDLIPEVK